MSGMSNTSIQRDGNGNATSAFRSTSTPPTSSSLPSPHAFTPTYASLHMNVDESPLREPNIHNVVNVPHHSRAQTPITTADQQQCNVEAAQRVIDAEQQIERLQQELLRMRNTLHQQQQHAQPIHAVQPAIRMRELRLPEPKEFRGTRDRVSIREWINDIEEIFTMGGLPMDYITTIVYAAHYLRDDAKTWYKMHKNSIMTWDHFKHLMIERYKDPREIDKARMRLMSMKQISSVE